MSQRVILHSAKLNNQAVSLVRQNRYAHANKLFAGALEAAKRAQELEAQMPKTPSMDRITHEELVEFAFTTDNDYVFAPAGVEGDGGAVLAATATSATGSSCTCSAQSACPQDLRAAPLPHPKAASAICVGVPTGSTAGYVYRKAMKIAVSDLQGHPQDAFSTTSFVIMFNLAITYHLMALEGSNGEGVHTAEDFAISERRMRSAVKLYELTFQVQNQGIVPHAVVTSAILNNLTLLHKALGNQEKFEACSNMLLSAVMLLVDLGVTKTTTSSSDNAASIEIVDGFLGTVMHLIIGKSAMAGAA